MNPNALTPKTIDRSSVLNHRAPPQFLIHADTDTKIQNPNATE